MEYIQIKNWEELQHYKDRTPPWIKLYNHLLDDFEFSCLPDASKAHLLSIWLLASRTGNKIPNNAKWIGNKINATEPVNLNSLISLGFIEVIPNENNEIQTLEQDASKMLQTLEQDACLEREERERESREDTSSKTKVSDRMDYKAIQESWNEHLTKAAAITVMTDKRKRIIKRLFVQFDMDIERWSNYLKYINGSEKCNWMFEERDRGNGQKWQPKGFEYIASEDCYLKVREQY